MLCLSCGRRMRIQYDTKSSFLAGHKLWIESKPICDAMQWASGRLIVDGFHLISPKSDLTFDVNSSFMEHLNKTLDAVFSRTGYPCTSMHGLGKRMDTSTWAWSILIAKSEKWWHHVHVLTSQNGGCHYLYVHRRWCSMGKLAILKHSKSRSFFLGVHEETSSITFNALAVAMKAPRTFSTFRVHAM